MLTFFKRIRKGLLQTGASRKYLLYAIGEILLVVIGILIAIQVNNLNEYRKDLMKEQLILKQLKEDYDSNLEQLEEKMQMREDIITASLKLLGYIDNPVDVRNDSIFYHLGTLLGDPTFDPINNDLLETGNLRLIRNEGLKRLLSNWSSDVLQVKEIEGEWRFIYRQILLPTIIHLGIARDVQNGYWENNQNLAFLLDFQSPGTIPIGNSKENRSYIELLNDPALEGIFSSAISVNRVGNMESSGLRKRILNILEMINTEIDR